MKPETPTTTRRAVLAGTAALAGAAALPALPAAAAETLTPVCLVDRAGFINRLHQWALYCPELGDRIDRLIANVERVLSTSEGTGELLETRSLCAEKLGRDPSLDYLVGGDVTYPNGKRCRMFELTDEEAAVTGEDAGRKFVQVYHDMDARARPGLQMFKGATLEGRYKDARDWMRWSFEQTGRPVPQIWPTLARASALAFGRGLFIWQRMIGGLERRGECGSTA